jgi:hypothetical protein
VPNNTPEEHYERAEKHAHLASEVAENSNDWEAARFYVSLGELELKLSFSAPSPPFVDPPLFPAYVGNVESSGDDEDDRP